MLGNSKNTNEGKNNLKYKRIIIKIIIVLFLFYSNDKLKNKEFIEKLSFFFLNIKKYKETVNLVGGGLLEIFTNKDKTIQIETKSGKIYKSDIVILSIPGGSYRFLGNPEKEPIAKKFFSFGYSSAILLYSVYPNCYPNSYNQGLQAIKLLSSKFKKIILVGFSAGGHLAGLLGTTQRNKLFNTIGMILCYPVISFIKNVHKESRDSFFGEKIKNDTKNQKLFSIENRVTSKTLPTFIWTVKPDKTVPYENTLYMLEKLKEKKVFHEYKIYETGRHGMALADEVRNGIKEFKNKEVAKWVGLACSFINNIVNQS